MKTPIQSAGEAMLTRRRTLGLLAAVTIPKTAVVAAAPVAHAAVADPLLDAINAYRAGTADFNANAPEDDDDAANAYGDISWRPPFDALIAWTAPATTREGAMAALRLAMDEEDIGYSDMVLPLITAALAYFEQEGAR